MTYSDLSAFEDTMSAVQIYIYRKNVCTKNLDLTYFFAILLIMLIWPVYRLNNKEFFQSLFYPFLSNKY